MVTARNSMLHSGTPKDLFLGDNDYCEYMTLALLLIIGDGALRLRCP
ncbi:MAG: hypothetical protein VX156_04700 [Pseudomonadota bacterium]|nr:hypothetical protein [Pseudomonadota bacterium]